MCRALDIAKTNINETKCANNSQGVVIDLSDPGKLQKVSIFFQMVK